MPVLKPQELVQNRVDAIKNYHECVGIEKAELDVSGGIDSAVMLMLLAKALGPKNVTAVYSSIHSSQQSVERARAVTKAANVHLIELDLSKVYEQIVEQCVDKYKDVEDQNVTSERMKKDPTIEGSLRSCLRAPVGRFMNRMSGGGLRHGTGNEDEDRWLRFYQKGGDGEVDTNPLAMLSKGEVYQLAVTLGVPEEIITCKPTPDLWGEGDSHNDEEELSKISGVEWTYSKVNPKTGEYLSVGTIERMSRFLDYYKAYFYSSNYPVNEFFVKEHHHTSSYVAQQANAKFGLTKEHLASAIKWNNATKHKENPNCPTLGTRWYLIEDGILTDELPKLF